MSDHTALATATAKQSPKIDILSVTLTQYVARLITTASCNMERNKCHQIYQWHIDSPLT